MNLFIIGATFDVIGKILIGIAVLLVHNKIRIEGKVDVKVFREMYYEKVVVIIGILSILTGYFFHVRSGFT